MSDDRAGAGRGSARRPSAPDRAPVTVSHANRSQRSTELGARISAAAGRTARVQATEKAVAAGFVDLETFLRDRHGSGAGIVAIAAELGCDPQVAAYLLRGLALPGERDPAHPVEVAAAARVGHPSIAAFLLARPAGSSPVRLAAELGQSVPWLLIRARRDGLADRLAIPRTPEDRAVILAAENGFASLSAFLLDLVQTQRWTRARIRAHTGLPLARIADLLTDAGAPALEDLRERDALDKIGWDSTLVEYVTDRNRTGWTLQRMSEELGHSPRWLRARVRLHNADHLVRPGGHRRDLSDGALLGDDGPGAEF